MPNRIKLSQRRFGVRRTVCARKAHSTKNLMRVRRGERASIPIVNQNLKETSMRRKLSLALTASAVFLLFQANASAQATRTWVSGVGDDANPCSRTAPCKTFAGAISKTAAAGEISVLDPGGFGAVTITKSITINGGAGLAGILAAGVNGVVINAASTDTVRLRNIDINGAGTGLIGVRVLSAAAVHIEQSVISGFTQQGISVETAANAQIFVSDTVSRDNTLAGLSVTSTVGIARTNITRSQFLRNGVGLHVRSGSRVSAINSMFSGNTGNGVQIEALVAGVTATANLDSSQISNNGGFGVVAGNASALATSTARLSNTLISNNIADGVKLLSVGVAETYANNMIRGNGVNGCVGCAAVAFD
jgi:hypothetical protein